MSKEINTILNSYHATTLWEMANAAGLQVTDSRGKKQNKADVVKKMRAEFFTKARVQASWQRLDKREQTVVNRLLLHGGTARTRRFRREISRVRLATIADKPGGRRYYSRVPYAEGYVGHPNRRNSRVFEDIIARLTYNGLVFSRDTASTLVGSPFKVQFHPGATLYIPEVIRRFLPEPEPVPEVTSDWQPARVEKGEPTLLLRDLYLYWDFVRRNDVALIQAGFVGKRGLKALNEILLTPDPVLKDVRREDETGRLYLLRRLLEHLKLVQKKNGYLRPVDQDSLRIPEYWSRSLAEQSSVCLEAWRHLEGQENLGHGAAQYGPRCAYAQQTMLDVLKAMSLAVWYEPQDFLERIQDRDTDFLFNEHSRVENYRGTWYYSYGGGYYYGHPKKLLEIFEKHETEFVSRCLSGFLQQLGVVELGYESQGQDIWSAFRLTPAGAAMLGAEHPPSSSPLVGGTDGEAQAGKLIIQPNFQLIAMGPVGLATLAQLDLFAERQSADRGAFQYRLSRESVYQAQQLGLDAAEVIRFLEQASQVELPQNVRRSLEEWAAQHERIVFRTGVSLLQAATPDLLSALMDQPHSGKYLARPVTPQVALLEGKQSKQLVSTLVKQGLFPAVSGDQPEAADHSVVIHADGTVRPIHAVPSLHLRGRLSRLAEETDNGEWRLTPASVRRAGGSKIKVLRLLEELRKLQRGAFPEELTDQIKAWGSYYGAAAAETLTLIEFSNHAALEELRYIPELKSVLIPFPAGNRALAVVPQAKLAQVKEILARLGLPVREGLKR